MKVSCDGCGRSYAVSDQYLGRNIRLKCKHCGATTLVRPGLPEPPPGAPAPGEVVTPPASPEPTPARPHSFGPAAPDPFAPVAGDAPAPAGPRPEAPSNVAYLPIPARSAADGELDAAFADLGRELAQETGEEPAGQADAGGAELDGLLPASIEEAADLLRPPTTVPPLPAGGGAAPPAPDPRPRLAERFEDGPKEATDVLDPPARSRARPALLAGVLIAVAGAAAAWLYPGAKLPAPPHDAPARAAAPSTSPAPAPAQAGSDAERPAAAPAARPETPSQPPAESAPVPPAAPPTPAPAAQEEPTPAPAAREEPTPTPRPARAPAAKKPPPVVAHVPPRNATRAAPRAAEPARPPPSAPTPAPEPIRIEPVPTPAPAEGALSPAPAPAPVSSDPSLPSLGDAAVATTFARHQADFDACVKAARAEDPGLVLNRAVTVTLTVQPSGKVLYPTLDDAEVTASELGRCLKRESAKMQFPPFGGEAVRIRQRLTLR